jgi:glycerophosphoryl diester phosphodiesterase
VETDVHATADGVLVAFHDRTLDRVTDASGQVAALPWSQVRRARIAGREPIPRFAELLSTWPELRIVVDPKADAAVDPLLAELRRHDAVDRVCVGSFSDARLARVRAALGPALCTSAGPAEVRRLRLASWGLAPRRLAQPRPDCVQIPPRHGIVPLVDRRMVDLAHALHLPVHVWTIDDAAHMHRLLDLGVDGIVTDDPATLRDVLVARGSWG